MKTLQRMPLWGKVLIVFILVIIISSICVSHNIGKLKQDKINLQNTIDKQINQIGVLKDANNFDSQILENQTEIEALKEQIFQLKDSVALLQQENAKYEAIIEEYKMINSFNAPISNFGCFKSYTDYRSLAPNPEYPTWQLQMEAYTDENGLRKIGEYYLCAIGTGWGLRVKDKATVYLSTGEQFNIIMCDTKADKDTDSDTHTYTVRDRSVVEFYVNKDILGDSVGYGDISKIIPIFAGKVTNIIKI
jgi:hypothetical protein